MPTLVPPNGLSLSKWTVYHQIVHQRWQSFLAIDEQRVLSRYARLGTTVTVYWASTHITPKELETTVPPAYAHRVVWSARGNSAYLFHLIFSSDTPVTMASDIGIGGDVFLYSEGIAWHTGKRWSNWQYSPYISEWSEHPFLAHGLKLTFNPKYLSMAWSRDITITTY